MNFFSSELLRAPLTKTAFGALALTGLFSILAILGWRDAFVFKVIWSGAGIAMYCGTALTALRATDHPQWSGLAASGVQVSATAAFFLLPLVWFNLDLGGVWARLWMNTTTSALGIAQISYVVRVNVPPRKQWLQHISVISTAASMGLLSLFISLSVGRKWLWKLMLICTIIAIASTSAVKMIQRGDK